MIVKHLSESEIRDYLDMLEGNIARLCVSDDPCEVAKQMAVATERINSICCTRIQDLLDKKDALNSLKSDK